MSTINKLLISLLMLSIITAIFPNSLAAQNNRRIRSRANVDAAKPALPYSIVIDPASNQRVEIILAVNTVTTVRCPETPGNLAIGNDAGLDQDKFKNGGYGFFLRPRQAGLSTNIVIDFNGKWTAEFYIKVVEVKGGARPGDFTGEVIIQKPNYQSELESALAGLSKSRAEVDRLQGRVSELETELKQQQQTKVEHNQIEVLKLVETYAQASYKPSPVVELAEGRARACQIGRAQRAGLGWLIVFEIENRAKEQLTISNARIDQYRVLTTSDNRQIPFKAKARIAFLIEPLEANGSEATLLPRQLNIVINGVSATLKITA